MDRQPRSIRVPADNCPRCNEDRTITQSATFTIPAVPGHGHRDPAPVDYVSPFCGHTWSTCWAVEYVA